MQQILNSQDRTRAFLKFLLFLLITIALVVTAIYFNFRVPVKENKWLQSELEDKRIENANQEIFVSKMEEAVVLLDSLDKNGSNNDLVKSRLSSIIGEMQTLGPNNKTIYGKMNKAIVEKFTTLNTAKIKLISLDGSDEKITELNNKLNDCNGKLAMSAKSISPTQ